jgi:hypothetical protein
MPAPAFIRDVLGFKLEIPEAVTKHQKAGSERKPHLVTEILLDNDLVMNLTVGEAAVAGELVTRMDWMVRSVAPIAPELNGIMESLERARTVIHDAFVGITAPIHKIMQPK